MNAAIEWAKSAGILAIGALIAFQLLSAAITHAFRDRTPEELAAMKASSPAAYKALALCKALGIDSPRVWNLVLGVVFARVNAAAATPASKPAAGSADQTWPPPDDPPPAPPEH